MARTERGLLTLGLLLALGGIAAAMYWPGLGAGFFFDDYDSVVNNESIRTLWPLPVPLNPPQEIPTTGRPLVNLSFALNYAVHGLSPAGYRAVNVALHVAAAMLLYGVAWRALLAWRPAGGERGVRVIAAALAALWCLHPLQTEAVAYVTQRTELMMSLALLATLYAAARAMGVGEAAPAGHSPPPAPSWQSRGWTIVAVLACAAGMASKEVMVVAPLIVLLYDRTFAAGGFAAALRQRKGLYLGLAATWLLLAWLVVRQSRDLSVGSHLGIGPLEYLSTQATVVLWYLWLSVWPRDLAIVHDWPVASTPLDALPWGLLTVALAAGVVVALVRLPRLGFVGAWFFLILGPTSSVLPIAAEIVAERRMHLPLAAVVAVVVAGAAEAAGLLRGDGRRRTATAMVLLAVVLAVLAAGVVRSVVRLRDYRSEEAIWMAATRTFPQSDQAWAGLASAYVHAVDPGKARDAAARAVALRPDNGQAQRVLGEALYSLGDLGAAEQAFRAAVKLHPEHPDLHYKLGATLMRLGRPAEAIEHLTEAVGSGPNRYDAERQLGMAYVMVGQVDRGVAVLLPLAQRISYHADFRFAAGWALAAGGRLAEAAAELEAAIGIDAGHLSAREQLALVRLRQGSPGEGVALLEKILADHPQALSAMERLAWVRATHPDPSVRDAAAALTWAQRAVDTGGGRDARAWTTLAAALAENGRWNDAQRALQQAAAAPGVAYRPDVQARIRLVAQAVREQRGPREDPATPER